MAFDTRQSRYLVTSYLITALLATVSASADHGTVLVSENGTKLLDALKDQNVSKIVIENNYTLDHELDEYAQDPLLLTRNITITGQHGKDTVLDLSFKRALVEICSNCVLTFDNITVTKERRGTGSIWDIFLGQPGSRIVAHNMFKLRLACTSEQHLAAVVSQTARSKFFPGSSQPQKFDFADITIHGHTYHQALRMIDYTADVPKTAQEGGPPYGGYALQEKDKVRLCMSTVPQDCLAKFSPDYCVIRMIDEAELAEEAAAHAAGSKPAPVVAIAVAVVAAVGLLAAVAAALLWMRKRRRQQQQKQPGRWDEEDGAPGKPKQNGAIDGVNGAQYGTFSKDEHDGDDEEVWEPMAMRKGWQMYHCMTTPLIASVDDDVVHFGRLLGSGSFGRVYLAKWAGRQVAVKVIEHSGDTSAVVENEVKLMITFNHPNVVRAFKFMNFTRTRKLSSIASGGISASGVMTGSGGCHRSRVGDGVGSAGGGNCGLVPHATCSAAAAAAAVSGSLLKQGSMNCQDVCVGAPGASSSSCGSNSASRNAVSAQLLSEQQPLNTSPIDSTATAEAATAAPKPLAPCGSSSGCSSNAHVAPMHGTPIGSSGKNYLQHSTGSPLARTSAPEATAAAAAATAVSGGTGAATGPTADFHAGFTAEFTRCSATHSGSSLGDTLGHVMMDQGVKAETWLITEFCDCGTLSGLVAKMQLPLNSDDRLLQLLLLLRDAAMGLQVLHDADVVHGDLNARNVLVSSSCMSPIGLMGKVADLGLSRTIKQHQTHRTTNTCGTMSHCPPELLHYGKMSAAGDVYAFAVMMWEVYCNQPAFKTLHYGQFFDTVVRHNLRPTIPPGMPEDYHNLMEHCWATNPADRPKVSQIIETLDFMIQSRQQVLLSNAALRSVSAPVGMLEAAAAASGAAGSAGDAEGGSAGTSGETASSVRSSPLPSLLAKPLPKRRTWDMEQLQQLHHQQAFDSAAAAAAAAAGPDAAAAVPPATAGDCGDDGSGEHVYIIPMHDDSPAAGAAVHDTDTAGAGAAAAAAAAPPPSGLLRSRTADASYTAVDMGACFAGLDTYLSEPLMSLQESHGRRSWFV